MRLILYISLPLRRGSPFLARLRRARLALAPFYQGLTALLLVKFTLTPTPRPLFSPSAL